ncbi:MAG: hypothetical protein M1832_000933 [Thelocarpon impressellum]|nr:MAG: hypothetical protein M1832_000933 [Thelocarpon impressellum]
MDIPPVSHAAVLAKFDALRAQGELLHSPTEPIYVEDDGFQFEFRICSAFATKPALPPSPSLGSAVTGAALPHVTGPADTLSSSSSSSLHTPPSPAPAVIPPTAAETEDDIPGTLTDFYVCAVPPAHHLALNRFAALRPHYLLLTDDPTARQTAALERADLRAAWVALQALEGAGSGAAVGEGEGEGDKGTEEAGLYVAIFNGGREAGCSRMHKHLQIFPEPPPRAGFTLFPDRAAAAGDPDAAPYAHSLRRLTPAERALPPHAAAEVLLDAYVRMLAHARAALCAPSAAPPPPHNVVLTRRWLLVVPRRRDGVGVATANAAGMLGLIWVKDGDGVAAWRAHGPRAVLGALGTEGGRWEL